MPAGSATGMPDLTCLLFPPAFPLLQEYIALRQVYAVMGMKEACKGLPSSRFLRLATSVGSSSPAASERSFSQTFQAGGRKLMNMLRRSSWLHGNGSGSSSSSGGKGNGNGGGVAAAGSGGSASSAAAGPAPAAARLPRVTEGDEEAAAAQEQPLNPPPSQQQQQPEQAGVELDGRHMSTSDDSYAPLRPEEQSLRSYFSASTKGGAKLPAALAEPDLPAAQAAAPAAAHQQQQRHPDQHQDTAAARLEQQPWLKPAASSESRSPALAAATGGNGERRGSKAYSRHLRGGSHTPEGSPTAAAAASGAVTSEHGGSKTYDRHLSGASQASDARK